MRRHLICAAAVLVATPALALDLPARKPGLWEIKTMMEGGMQPTQTAQHCIDGETDKLMNSLGTDMGKQICSKQDVKKVGNTYKVRDAEVLGVNVASYLRSAFEDYLSQNGGHTRALVTVLNTFLAVPSVVVGLVVYLLLSRSGPLGFLGCILGSLLS